MADSPYPSSVRLVPGRDGRAAPGCWNVPRRLHSPVGWCFLAPTRASKQMHATTLAQVVLTIYGGRCTVHGFHSSFRDWASEQTSVPHAVAEAALAHQVGSDVERSYAWSELFEKRRGLMDRWAEFVTTPMS